ncbi:MAG: tRNA pseudouridine(55) synthase TruB [candidate division Zixibacteria bacterium]|nr:tRNA pseudouridine(55) synthase TruB [candidate division Zixibacteria bacterium]
MKRSEANHHGILLVDKPVGMSSHDVVDRVRRLFVQKAVGHAGTLDPAAEGLLVIMLGKGTKAASYLVNEDKEYEAEVRLGIESPTYDREGVTDDAQLTPVPLLTEQELERILALFRGAITQKVPPFSAVHVNGERLYRKSRRGEEVTVPERNVIIETLDLVSHDTDRLRLKVVCSKGTYIRSLAHEIGGRVGCGGYLAALCRTRCGRFRLDESHTLDQLAIARDQGRLAELVMPIDRALGFSAVTVADSFYSHAIHGRRPKACDISAVIGEFRSGDHILLRDTRGCVLAIATAVVASGALAANPESEVLKYDRVLV